MVAKKAIARKACSLIPPGQTVFLDAGSTTTALAEVIAHQDNLIVTNGISCAMKLNNT